MFEPDFTYIFLLAYEKTFIFKQSFESEFVFFPYGRIRIKFLSDHPHQDAISLLKIH